MPATSKQKAARVQQATKKVILIITSSVLGLSLVTHLGIGYLVAAQGVEMSLHGHIAMALGIFFTYGVGAGLMALLFFSNRDGHDDAVHNSVTTAKK